MKNVYDNDVEGGYTEDAKEIDRNVKNLLRNEIRRMLENEMTTEAIEYLIFHAALDEIYRQKHLIRIGKDVDGRECRLEQEN